MHFFGASLYARWRTAALERMAASGRQRRARPLHFASVSCPHSLPSMDNSPSKRSPLFKLPPTVWGNITAMLDSRAIVHFERCSPFSLAFVRSPHVVHRMHIAISTTSKAKVTTWPHHWFRAYPSLTDVGLTLNGSSKLLLTKDDLHKLSALRHFHLGFADPFGDELILSLPRQLSTLSLDHNLLITDHGISVLPEWLETLLLPANVRLTSACISKLPKTLKTLAFATQDEITPELMSLMPALSSLRYCGSQRIPGPSVAVLPPSLTILTWSTSAPMGTDAIQRLPKGIKSLHVEKMESPSESLPALPSELLRLFISSFTGTIPTKLFQLLPRGLSYLEITSLKELTPSTSMQLPPTLASLVLPSVRNCLRDDILGLPRSLHIIKFPLLENFCDEWFAALPPRIHYFACRWNEDISDNLLDFSPPSLHRLELKTIAERTGYWSSTSVAQPIDDYIKCAPQFPRAPRYRARSFVKWDTYFFDVDVLQKRLRPFDIYPRTVPETKDMARDMQT